MLKENIKKNLYKLAPLLTLLCLIVLFSLLSEYFLSFENIFSIIVQSSVLGMLSLGVTFVIVMAGIDLSLGSVVAICSVIIGVVSGYWGLPLYLGALAGILMGSLVGFIQGFLISYLGITAFVVTLGGMMICRGLSFVITNGQAIYFASDDLIRFSENSLWGIPYPAILFIILAIISHLLLAKTTFGRYLYAIGSNEIATKLSGVNIRKIKIIAYILCSSLVGVGAIIITSRLNSGSPTAGESYELLAIAAVVIGGTSLFGGTGTIWGSVIGTILMGVLNNGLNLLDVNQFWQMILTGAILIFAVYVDGVRKKKG